MHCASCAVIIKDRLEKMEGVHKADINFATEKAAVEYDTEKVSLERMNNEIGKLGYSMSGNGEPVPGMESEMKGMDHAEHLGMGMSKKQKEEELKKQKTKTIFAFSASLIVFIFYGVEYHRRAYSVGPGAHGADCDHKRRILRRFFIHYFLDRKAVSHGNREIH